ncbi:hypothetical protein [Methylocystis echinoides]|jgi:hypothetical protein
MVAVAIMPAVAKSHLCAGMGVRGGERIRPRRRESRDDDEGTDEKA